MAKSLTTSENKNKKDQEEAEGNTTIDALSPKNMDLLEAKTVDYTVANKKNLQL